MVFTSRGTFIFETANKVLRLLNLSDILNFDMVYDKIRVSRGNRFPSFPSFHGFPSFPSFPRFCYRFFPRFDISHLMLTCLRRNKALIPLFSKISIPPAESSASGHRHISLMPIGPLSFSFRAKNKTFLCSGGKIPRIPRFFFQIPRFFLDFFRFLDFLSILFLQSPGHPG